MKNIIKKVICTVILFTHKTNTKYYNLPWRVVCVILVHIVLMLAVSVVLRDTPVVNDLHENGVAIKFLHPVLLILFYTPSLVSALVSVVTITTLKDKYYPGNKELTKALFYLLLCLGIVSRLMTNPNFFLHPKSIVITLILYFIIHKFYTWKDPNKKWVLLIIVSIFIILTSATVINYILLKQTGHNFYENFLAEGKQLDMYNNNKTTYSNYSVISFMVTVFSTSFCTISEFFGNIIHNMENVGDSQDSSGAGACTSESSSSAGYSSSLPSGSSPDKGYIKQLSKEE